MLKNNFVIWFNLSLWILGLFFIGSLEGCLQGPEEKKDPLSSLAGTYTAFESTMECLPESEYWDITIVPPILTSSLNIQSNKMFTWTVTIIEDEGGLVSNCFGVTSASITVPGTVSGDKTTLIFDGGENGIDSYTWILKNGVLSLSSNDGEETFKFNKQ